MILCCKKKAERIFKGSMGSPGSVRYYHLRWWERCCEREMLVWGFKAPGRVTLSEGDDHVSCFYYSFCLFGFLASRNRVKESLREYLQIVSCGLKVLHSWRALKTQTCFRLVR